VIDQFFALTASSITYTAIVDHALHWTFLNF